MLNPGARSYKKNDKGRDDFCLGESSFCESQPGAVKVEDQGHVLGSSRRLDGRDAG